MQTSNNRRSRRNTKARMGMLGVEEKQLSALTEILTIEKSQQRGLVERTPDVPKMKIKRDKVYTFVRAFDAGQIVNSTVGPVGFSSAPALGNLPGFTDVTNMWEQYRIVQISWVFVPLYAGSVQQPIYTWFDQDDATTPTDVTEAFQSETMRITPIGTSAERTVTPSILVSGTATGTVNGGYIAISPFTWCDEAYANTKFYGIKAIAPANTNIANAVPLYSVLGSVVIQVRKPK